MWWKRNWVINGSNIELKNVNSKSENVVESNLNYNDLLLLFINNF
jgi:hypothetical protein